jgi:hypothetical protein
LLLCLVTGAFDAQFTYFNEICGELSDTLGDTFTDVEIINDTIYTYAAYADPSGQYLQLKKYDRTGELIISKEFELDNNTTYFIEFKYSYVKDNNSENLYFSFGLSDSISSRGIVGKVNEDLDTLWTKQYDHYNPHTYLRGNLDIDDGIILVGEIESDGSQRGTMLTKIDYDGIIIWDEVLGHANGNINRNANVIRKGGYLFLGGSVRSDGILVGLLTKTDLNGNVLWENFYDDSQEPIETNSSSYTVEILDSGDAISVNSVDNESAGPSTLDWYIKVIVNKVDFENDSIYWE